MEPDSSFEKIAERIVRWAADHPLSREETQQRYRDLLAGLPAVPERPTAWSALTLGRLVLRFWNERVEEFRGAVDALTPAPGLAFRGGPPAGPSAPSERVLKKAGRTGSACLKVVENPDHASVALTLWVEPAAAFTVTVQGADGAIEQGPIACAAGSVLSFASVSPAAEHVLVFTTEAESWDLRWQIAPSEA